MLIEAVIFLVTAVLTYLYYNYKQIHHYFDARGIKYVPGWPLFGNTIRSSFKKTHMVEDLDAVYRAYPDERYVGYIEGIKNIIMIRDPEIIKAVTVKDFEHFVDHRDFIPVEVEPLMGDSMFSMKGDRWRDMRTTLSPAFTSSKMRRMMPFMNEISANIIEYVKEHIDEDMNIDDLIRRYTNDVIASTAFGLTVNSLKDKDNEFYRTGQGLFNFSFFRRIIFIINMLFPAVAKILGVRIFPPEGTSFFMNIVSGTMEHREKNNIERPDMIQLLMEASKGKLKTDKEGTDEVATEYELKSTDTSRNWSQSELAGQVFIFFAAGFESSASTLVMLLHEIALNNEVQEKLYQEIREFQEKHGSLVYDRISDLKYLDCVLNEALRKWSVAVVADRVCTKPYELPPPRDGGKPCKLNLNDIVYTPINSLHMDPLYFPNPQVFDPERFSDENKNNIKPFTFMPFGAGPRICIGIRFAVMELKVLLYYLIANFKVVKCSKTSDPPLLAPEDVKIMAKGGSWAKFEVRK
ncbi:probable cytochrome P450 9f2 [Pieris rapae]|uniref:probable cytochrome P450 9f2 n=1 Tax=Pieris rapae TaxID=64459 RepID=UPI001E27E20C|nr:probable cytochrome P450 9f2 [Pieris rapae]